VNAGDADAWIKLWDDRGVQLTPGAPANVGKDAILRAMRGAFETNDYQEMVINNEEVEVSGDFGFARGTYSLLLVPRAGGDGIPLDGKYLTIFKKQPDGIWKIYRDAFNSNVAPD
jgi:ketosteroid isomerase-like protein